MPGDATAIVPSKDIDSLENDFKIPVNPIPKVFLDANIFINAGKKANDAVLERIPDLIQAGLISVLTTDLTVTEVAKHWAEFDFKTIEAVVKPRFRAKLSETLGVTLPNITESELRKKLITTYEKQVLDSLKRFSAQILSIDDILPSVVFGSYANRDGLFTEGKKDQFPDAFIFECLKKQATEKHPVIIVSKDGDFEYPVKGQPHISLLKSLPALFQQLGLAHEPAPDLDAFLVDHYGELLEIVDKELSEWGLQATDIEDAEIEEASVTEITLGDLISFGSSEGNGPILVSGTLEISASVSYNHPEWESAIYDSEDKVAIPLHHVNGQTVISFEANFSLHIQVDENGVPSGIDSFAFRDDDFVWVELDPTDYQ